MRLHMTSTISLLALSVIGLAPLSAAEVNYPAPILPSDTVVIAGTAPTTTGAGQVKIGGGTVRAAGDILAGGSLGVGGIVPAYALHVERAGQAFAWIRGNTATNVGGVTVQADGQGVVQLIQYGTAAIGTYYGLPLAGLALLITNTAGTAYPSNLLIANSGSGSLAFGTNGSLRHTIDNSGLHTFIGGVTPGTPTATNVNIGNGAGKFGAGVSCTTLTASSTVRIGNFGALTPTSALAVAGTITAKEILVTTTGADYVFADDHQLMPLTDVEQFIKREKHLPGIAPASEMQTQGMAVADQMTKHLAKIEELTLYAIDLQKQNDALRQQLVATQTQQADILRRLDALETH